MTRFRQHSSHWGAFTARMRDGRLELKPFDRDPDPSPLLANLAAAIDHPARLRRPLVRRGWLDDGPGPDPRRGSDGYVEMDWDGALALTAAELRRLGAGPDLPQAGALPGAQVFGGSYGWASAGRFHHAQSQVHRFLNTVFGGYVGSVDTYSTGAGSVILSLVWGPSPVLTRDHPTWRELKDETELLIAFGGLPLRNLAISPGGNSEHAARSVLEAAARRGCQFVSISPLADDVADIGDPTRLAPRPATDTALMLGMAHRLHATGRVNRAYLDRYTTGYERFEAYLTGAADGVAKTPEWAASICGISAKDIAGLADRAASRRTLVTVSYALQRAENGEQPVWMALTLSAMLGQGHLPGAGFCYGLGSIGNIGKDKLDVPLPTFPQGRNRVADFIPVARISDLLLKPGEAYTYKGETRHYADIRLVYWAGGNPFHHHQDLAKLRAAFARPDTIVMHESVATASTRHADIVFPATITAEREDVGAAANEPFLFAMEPLVERPETAGCGPRDDYDLFCALADRLGCGPAFSEGRSAGEWLAAMYEPTRAALAARGLAAPDYEAFREGGVLALPLRDEEGAIRRFHRDPAANPLQTPSGRIELWSDVVAAAGLPGHPAWLPPREWLGAPQAARHPFQLVANQPANRLHSQLDFGATSMAGKTAGREPARLNPADAARLEIAAGDVIRLWNDRGGVLAAAAVSAAIAPGVVQLATGAWYAPVDLPGVGPTCVNGNPNAVTADIGASPLSQGCAGQLSLVSIEKWRGAVPPVVPHAAFAAAERSDPA
ncbi:molybdopterin-dependent oxidoreductase [Jiella sonneratiae]|uniref:Molybdopterin-dependent oxidoreductase n=1 Tax=Jiella sonneratiae TaxID=2816856 RepID=A0ABS3JAR4_9HYPH|nr:molybdopterin-dependent oxidoreductase [Jiella sonneratiae]MBO0906247.1 molybdopterin-dependent oxidoreductase [Jiella sonneratiae]